MSCHQSYVDWVVNQDEEGDKKSAIGSNNNEGIDIYFANIA